VTKNEGLSEYHRKRDLTVSGEPGGRSKATAKGDSPRFVVQRHDASSLHFDFRLEVDGVLKSWAVPKGPSTNPSDKRLAARTEDHPLDYAEFEGRIPEGQYGAGTVIVWDTGSYRNLTERDGRTVPVGRAIEEGHLTVWLEGEKLVGGFALTKAKLRGGEQWLLVKKNDEGADRRHKPTRTQLTSVLSGRTNEDLDNAADRQTGDESDDGTGHHPIPGR
jgi:DNA ligase D-like protein (predicted 3'-phosphoesterase)